ncbi:MAG: hypothetical protein K8M05_28670 [Deltaproteobacteria bacterium]|nr:hypothetical protein [Kofleriaceae bacterium]
MSDEKEIPPAVVVQDGKVPGDVPTKSGPPGQRPKYHRRLSNYLLDKKMQLRYVIVVTLVSMTISGTLGWMIYNQEHRASEDLVAGLADLTGDDASLAEYQRDTERDIAARDRRLVLEMVGVGVALTLILSGYLIIMTHKVAGPLFKIGIYMEQMAEGKVGNTTPLRKGDMLLDFYDAFREAHGAVRTRLRSDTEAMGALVKAVGAAPGELSATASDEVDELRRHVEHREKSLS